MQRRATWDMIESRDVTIKYLDERISRQQTEIEQLRIENERLRVALRRLTDEAERVCLSDGGMRYVHLANATEGAIETMRQNPLSQ